MMEDICLTIGNSKVLNKINFEVKKEEVVALVGDSGSGKHVLVEMLAGIF